MKKWQITPYLQLVNSKTTNIDGWWPLPTDYKQSDIDAAKQEITMGYGKSVNSQWKIAVDIELA